LPTSESLSIHDLENNATAIERGFVMSANWNSDSLLHGLQQNVTGDETISQLDSMR